MLIEESGKKNGEKTEKKVTAFESRKEAATVISFSCTHMNCNEDVYGRMLNTFRIDLIIALTLS